MPKWGIFNASLLLNEHGHPPFLFQNWSYRMTNIQWTKFEQKSSHFYFRGITLTWNLFYTTSVLRAPAWENWESCDSDYCGTLFIIRLKIPFGELFSKIIILSSSVFVFSKKNSKVWKWAQSAFSAQWNAPNNTERRSIR